MKLEIEYVDINTLKKYENNSKLHPAEQVQKIADSIAEFGMCDPISVDENMTILEGHGRLMALELMQEEQCPIIRVEHLTEVQKKAYIIAHNKLTMSSEFDIEILEAEIAAIMEESEDLTLVMGFSEDEFNELTGGIEEPEPFEAQADEEDTPEVEDNPVIKFGDLIEFQDGCKIICGDSTDEDTYKKLMAGNKARMVNTEPPYGVSYQADKSRFDAIVNDDLTGDSLKDFLIMCFRCLHKYTIENPALYIFHASITQKVFEEALEKTDFRVKQQIIWKKNMFAFGRSDYHWIHEPMFYCVKNDKNSQWFGDRCATTCTTEDLEDLDKNELITMIKQITENSTVWEISRDSTALYVHPTQKPVALAERAILNSSERGDIVLEPFSGSGSTLVAGAKTGRRVYAIEFDMGYVQVGITRHIEYTGKSMIKINGKEVDWNEYKAEQKE